MANETQKEYSQESLNHILTTTAASLSIAGTMVIFFTFFLWPDLRTNARRMITYMSVGDFMLAVGNIVGLWGSKVSINHHDVICKVQATFGIAAVLSSFFWTVYLSLYFYLTICRRISRESEKRVMILFHLTAWGIPLVIALLAVVLNEVGQGNDFVSAGWCWIGNTKKTWMETTIWMFIAGKGWEFISYFAITLFYVLVKLQIRREVNSGAHTGGVLLTQRSLELAKQVDHKLTLIPFVFIWLRIWGTIRFIRFLLCLPTCFKDGPSPHEWLIILHGIGDSTQGFANFILFCLLTQKIRQRFGKCVSRFLCCSPRENDTLYVYESTNLIYDSED